MLDQQVLLTALIQLASHIDSSQLPEHTKQLLTDIGIPSRSTSRDAYLQRLTDAASDLTQPRHPNDFFHTYDALLPAIVAHDILSHQTLDQLAYAIQARTDYSSLWQIIVTYLTEADEIESRLAPSPPSSPSPGA